MDLLYLSTRRSHSFAFKVEIKCIILNTGRQLSNSKLTSSMSCVVPLRTICCILTSTLLSPPLALSRKHSVEYIECPKDVLQLPVVELSSTGESLSPEHLEPPHLKVSCLLVQRRLQKRGHGIRDPSVARTVDQCFGPFMMTVERVSLSSTSTTLCVNLVCPGNPPFPKHLTSMIISLRKAYMTL